MEVVTLLMETECRLDIPIHFGKRDIILTLWVKKIPYGQFNYIVRQAIKHHLSNTFYLLPYVDFSMEEEKNLRKIFEQEKNVKKTINKAKKSLKEITLDPEEKQKLEEIIRINSDKIKQLTTSMPKCSKTLYIASSEIQVYEFLSNLHGNLGSEIKRILHQQLIDTRKFISSSNQNLTMTNNNMHISSGLSQYNIPTQFTNHNAAIASQPKVALKNNLNNNPKDNDFSQSISEEEKKKEAAKNLDKLGQGFIRKRRKN